jgi:hypothetical protein
LFIKIGDAEKEGLPKKKSWKQLLEDGVNYDKIHPYASIPFPQRLKKQEDAKQFSRFLDIFKGL